MDIFHAFSEDTAIVVSTPPSTGNFVEDFFQHLPSISNQHQSPHMIALHMTHAYPGMVKFLLDAESKQSNDPDKDFLVGIVKKGLQNTNPQYVLQHLAALGLNSSVAADDKSIKASHLRYYKWVAQGRKDEDSPFAKSISVPHDTLPSDPNGSICGNCGDSGATKKCLGCVITFGNHISFSTVYCNQGCQKAHWNQHRSDCRALKRLHISMSIFQPIFEHHVGSVYDTKIEKISEDNGVIHAKAQDGWDKSAAYQGKHIVTKFRHGLAPSKDAGTAVLMNGNCCQFVDFGKSLTGFFLKGFPYKSVEKISFFVKNCHRSVLLEVDGSSSFSTFPAHQVLRVTLASGRKVVLDPSGAQFGWREFMTPWETYNQHRVHAILIESPYLIETPPETMLEKGLQTNAYGNDTLAFMTQMAEKVAAHLPSIAEASLLDPKSTGPAAEALRTSFVSQAKAFIDRLAKHFEDSPAFKLYFTPSFGIQTTTGNPREYAAFKKVWFTAHDYNRYKNRPQLLKAMWNARLKAVGVTARVNSDT
ncbi:hypothetical protein B0T24DRAFT_567122 [Lasiosphaeria ovina]|uniref:MYND-type domain-containing protein n=1 Tax=Lasiosphaeria ovina TaxID=92902 RepID=A0AAE0TY92_9PEZI|nr:hypothetical protein B0T24DRAFT_567122 [Lasiosphaeria ovina]